LRSIVCGVVKRKLFGKLLGKCFNVFKSKKKKYEKRFKNIKTKNKNKNKKISVLLTVVKKKKNSRAATWATFSGSGDHVGIPNLLLPPLTCAATPDLLGWPHGHSYLVGMAA